MLRRPVHTVYRSALRGADRMRAVLGGDTTDLIVLGALVGVITGLVAVVFVWLVHAIGMAVWPGHPTMDPGHAGETVSSPLLDLFGGELPPAYALLVVPVGMLLVSWFTRAVAPEAAGHGVPEVMEAIAQRGGRMQAKVGWVKVLASSVNIGLGGSVGKEGPIVQVGAAFGSAIGRVFLVRRRRLRTLVGCGAAAGIAAVFNAPIGGVMFALEIIIGSYEVKSFTPIVIASVLGAVTARDFLGDAPAFNVPEQLREGLTMVHGWELLAYAVMGLALGVVSVGFTRGLYKLEDLFAGWSLGPLGKAAVAGLLVGALGMWLPDLLGEGHHAMTRILHSDVAGDSWKILLAIGVIKVLATGLTLGGGGSGGVFAPSLFVGAALGGAFGQLVDALSPVPVGSFGAYALAGMAAVLAGTAHAPLTGILLMFEMSDNYLMILPLMTSAVLSATIAQRLLSDSVYTLKLSRQGIVLRDREDGALLESLRVADAMGPPGETIADTTTFDRIVHRLLRGEQHDFPVVDAEGRMVGALSLDDMREFLRNEHLGSLLLARDCARTVQTLPPNATLLEAFDVFESSDAIELPIVVGDRLVGSLHRTDVLTTYRRALAAATR